MAKPGNIYFGIGGWNFAPWRGVFYPKGLPQAKELHYAGAAPHLDRDQRHLLRLAEAGELPQMGAAKCRTASSSR